MKDLQFALSVLGGCAIFAVLVHGLWTIRKNAELKADDEAVVDEESTSVDGLSFSAERESSNLEETNDAVGSATSLDASQPDYQEDSLSEPVFSAAEDLTTDDQQAAPVQADGSTIGSDESAVSEQEIASLDTEIPSPTVYSGADVLSTHSDETKPTDESETDELDGFDEYGIGKVRTLEQQEIPAARRELPQGPIYSNPLTAMTDTAIDAAPPPKSLLKDTQNAEQLVVEDESFPQVASQQPQQLSEHSVDQPKEAQSAGHNTTAGTDNTDAMAGLGLTADPADRPLSKNSVARGRRAKRSRTNEEQMSIDFEQPKTTQKGFETPPKTKSVSSDKQLEPEILTIHVSCTEQQMIDGARLLPLLLTLGFKFGEHDIFHRHQQTDGTGDSLFSLANMFKPGVFDLDNMEQFSSRGLVLFMTLPMTTDARKVFTMMHNAARKIADEFGASVLDGKRSTLTKRGSQRYIERIREFERKQMLQR